VSIKSGWSDALHGALTVSCRAVFWRAVFAMHRVSNCLHGFFDQFAIVLLTRVWQSVQEGDDVPNVIPLWLGQADKMIIVLSFDTALAVAPAAQATQGVFNCKYPSRSPSLIS